MRDLRQDDIDRRSLLRLGGGTAAALAVAPLASSAVAARRDPVAEGSLRKLADSKGLYCGTAVLASDLDRPEIRGALRADCNILVPEVEMKWGVVQHSPGGPLDFSAAEKIHRFAVANDMKLRGHALCWWNSQPAWAKEFFADKSARETGDYIQKYIHAVASHWRGRVVQWDVVNEPVGGEDRILDELLGPKMGDSFMDLAFETAADADPGALRVLNHDWIAQDMPYQQRQFDSTVRLIDRLMNRGVKIQCFGFEGHLMTAHGFMEAKWRRFCDDLTGMGLKLMITELDVDDAGTEGDIAHRDRESAALAGAVLDMMLSYPQCLGVLSWGVSDGQSWLRKEPGRARKDGKPQRPAPRDDRLKPKPIWQAIAKAIGNAPPRPA
ncbi:MAG: endo-1,4-beta-xylanase [Sphingobium sp.]